MNIRVGSLVQYIEDGDIGIVTKILKVKADPTNSGASFWGSIFFFKDEREYHNFSVDISLPQHVSNITDCVLLGQ